MAKAGIPTPWPNPGIGIGSELASGRDVTVNEVIPIGSLSFTIPLSDRLSRQDDVNQALAQLAQADALATFRELYLNLRARYVQLTVAKKREKVREAVVEAARTSLNTANALVTAGGATALDVSLFELEYARERSRLLGARLEVTNSTSDLSELVAVSPWRLGTLPEDALPTAPEDIPSAEELRDLIVREHPELFRLRSEYEVAERQLHLEITRQYPDLVFGSSLGGEVGERKTILGLNLGIELPIFDRNQQAIAQASKRRDEVRTRYEAAAHRILNAVARTRGVVALAAEQHRILRDDVLPSARSNVDIAQQSLAAGSAGALQLLDAERSLRQVQVEVLEAQMAEQLAWSNLEQAVGFPLLRFPTDPDSQGRTPPREVAEEEPNRPQSETPDNAPAGEAR
ncbi:MAG TPA: TolC family protein [bacterium]|nr:TolC family protein [bacterium]